MFTNKKQLDRIEKKLEALDRRIEQFYNIFLVEWHTIVATMTERGEAKQHRITIERPVSPAKAPKKRGRPAKKPEFDPEFFKKELKKPAKKITTKKK